MNTSKLVVYIAIMAGITYLVRMLPLAIFRKKIKNAFIKSFLNYVPYAVLSAMTFPAILSSTASIYSAIVGLLVAVTLAYFNKSLLTVALSACGSVFIVEFVLTKLLLI